MYEIERKFLISTNKIPVLSYETIHNSLHNELFYIQTNHEIKFRKETVGYSEDRKYYKTENGIETPITEDEYYDNFPRHISNVITYRSYRLDDGDQCFLNTYNDIDFNIAVVKFKNKEESVRFIIPEWFGEEVTGIDKYNDVNIVTK